MSQPFRLPAGGQIDRAATLGFRFDGREYQGHPGDTLASALLANGVGLTGRSFKYHRPRGILSAGAEEPNALVELRRGARREPNSRATMVELFDGLDAQSQNRWPSLGFDLMAVNGLLSPVFAAGFYYKTFMWPARFWEKVYEPLIRRAAGLGRAATEPDPDHYEKATIHCDVLVVGAGPAGLAAALAAGRSGARVILCDEGFRLGGSLLSERRAVGDQAAPGWAAAAEAELAALPEVRLLRRTTAFGVFDHGTYGAVERVGDHLAVPEPHAPRQRLWRIVAKRCVLAAGSLERPLVFGDNDRPGVMLAGAVRTYLNRHAVAPGRRAVIFANNDAAGAVAADLAASGVAVEAIVDARPEAQLDRAARDAGTRLLAGAVVTRAVGGARGLHAAEVRDAAGRTVTLPCDLLAMSGGFSPNVHLTSHLGGRPAWNPGLAAFVPGDLPPGMAVAGSAAGVFDLAGCLSGGGKAGVESARDCGYDGGAFDPPAVAAESTGVSALWRVKGGGGKRFVDFQNDVTDKDIELAEREGFRAVEHLKRYTTLGMATDQGKTSNVNAIGIMAEITARDIDAVGSTRFRPPYTPVSLGAFAGHARGRDFRPTRLTPSHDWAAEQGAVFVEAGAWLRAQYFPRPGEKDWLETVNREVRRTRSAVGICDVSTLGKIDLQGADAAEFLNRLYINGWSTLAVGRARYGLMLREDGIVMDDGTTSRLADDRFLVTTTTANAAKVMQHMEFCHQCLWPELDVQFTSVSDQWAQFSVAGPRARDLLSRIVDPPFDIGNAAFPYLGAAELTVCGGVTARLFRISFSGELAYEVAVPARYGDALVRRLMETGKDLGITPYGTEALGVMRVEKGHVAGNELNGQTTAADLGLGRMMSTKKDYIGRVLAGRPGLADPARPSVIGFRPVDRSRRLRAGAHFIADGAAATTENDQGFMTSVAFSPMLGHWIGLGLLARGAERIGETLRACDPVRGEEIAVEVVSAVFYDPDGERLRV
ncbi:sarcosine oxidase subunit alpha [Inquilinus ginsengisoli]|uniref:Sarcosine oxidase subunit alpha n=1 Tax=Inquilinus ginsengisoli TaxID=363840 RepID=A0ABU1JJ36_9PROT|nr:sarcosine oxidase subunit alpha family protein [Inquilinus ginsengisoli]MDR6288327.1 sarcosine oxidase subunit alpha [Inquilinus ginsengisoli]